MKEATGIASEKLRYALEGLPGLDPEIQWAAHELASLHVQAEKKSRRKPTVIGMARAYCPAVADIVAERLGSETGAERLSAQEASEIGSDALIRFDAEQKLTFLERIDLASRVVVAAAKLRSISPVQHGESTVSYWPFGVDGGFCNPRKLAELND